MKFSRAGWVLLTVVTAVLASEPVLARGHGGSGGGGRSGHHSGAARAGHPSGVRHHGTSRLFVGGVAAAPALWPWWDYPGYRVAGVYPGEPVYYIEQNDPGEQPQGEWLYCRPANAYFPYVAECATGWERVAPQLPPG
ncbi:MAG: hypothetical protein JWN13_5843 [Betaproteobacteria bacterium]|nr:hypothetical protein [Betaproteobacteria bacterium]